MPTQVKCGVCRQQYDSDRQAPVCPHKSIEEIERERKAKTEEGLGLTPPTEAR
jgi:hypothetical protein